MSKLSLPSLIESFLEMMLAERGASSHTLSAYRTDLTFLFDTYPNISLTTLSEKDLKAVLSHPLFLRLSPSSRARKISAFRQFFRFLCLENFLNQDFSSVFDRPKLPKKLPHYLSEEDMLNLLNAAEKDASCEGIRLMALLEVLYSTGVRVSELVSLPLEIFSPLDFEKPTLHITIEGKGQRERVCLLGPAALKALKAYLPLRSYFMEECPTPQQKKYLFPSSGHAGHLTRQGFAKQLKKVALVAGIDPDKVSPHIIRHAFATHLLRGGADLRSLQTLLGHQDISTTEVYTHVVDDHLHATMENCHPLSEGSIFAKKKE